MYRRQLADKWLREQRPEEWAVLDLLAKERTRDWPDDELKEVLLKVQQDQMKEIERGRRASTEPDRAD